MPETRLNPTNAPAPVGDDGVWMEVLNRPKPSPRPSALFLDRDGVIVEEVHYLHKPEEVRLVPGAAETIRAANRAGVAVVVVTNQAGIGYGLYGWREFAVVQEKVLNDLSREDAFVNAVVACPFHAKGKPPYLAADHPCRKPNPGMLLKAADHVALALETSWIVGDRGAGDIGAGRNAGLAGGVHVRTGHGERADEWRQAAALKTSTYSVLGAPSIAEVTDIIPLFDG